MTRIGIISDTHGCCDEAILNALKDCNEVWHGGDFGAGVADKLQKQWPIRGVYGNIDGDGIRKEFPLRAVFNCEGVNVAMIHIGGYPGNYAPGVKEWLQVSKPDMFICGHSHILKVVRDKAINNMLCVNPGAAGRIGFHAVRTLVRFSIDGNRIFDMEAVEIGKK